ncbi:hypothetical protein WJU23_06905 [Prosthecobacter sp. SYSU 5D2]|uniref:hypothetical protein n=1 Tax=Prosthecobacter sp. SYSU 5D2 TaxID=3134134 RepID=UPI0031FF3614
MILCLESSLLGGYLSNEVPGLVTGMLHVAGSKQPVRVEMVGNFLRDIAGCRVDLHNPLPHGDMDEVAWLSPQQFGFSGVMTASYRVAKLPRRRSSGDIVLPEPQGLKNLLFLEWFNQQSQRVLIQSWHLQMRVSAPRWQMSGEEEATLLRQARARRKHFLLNQRGTQDKANALHAPGMPDPFEPHDLSSGDPFASLEESLFSSHPGNERKSNLPNPAKRSQALAEELRRFEHLLVFNEEVRTRPAVMHLLSTVADLTAHLVHVLRQFSESKNAHWHFLVVDLEQSLPLFAAALNATDKMIQHANPGTDLGWLAMVQASLLNIELRMRELLTMLR